MHLLLLLLLLLSCCYACGEGRNELMRHKHCMFIPLNVGNDTG